MFKKILFLLILTSPLHATNWNAGTALNKARWAGANIQLDDNRILSMGGRLASSGNSTNYAEIFDPTTNTWTATGRMISPRMFFEAIKLSDGKVMVVGGANEDFSILLTSCEVYNPATGVWVSTGNITSRRHHGGIFLMSTGKVLYAGGQNLAGTPQTTAELFDPTTGVWTATTSLNTARMSAFYAKTGDGRPVMISGNFPGTPNMEVFAGTWTTVALPALSGSPTLWDYWETNSAVTLANGNVFAVGGQTSAGSGVAHYAIIFNQTLNTASAATDLPMDLGMINTWLMSDGNVLAAGGHTTVTSSATWVYNVSGNSWTRHGYLLAATEQPSLLAPNTYLSGVPLLVGGINGSTVLTNVEYFGDLPVTASSTDGIPQELNFLEDMGPS